MPPYSSPVNCCEFVWSVFKREFAKQISRIRVNYDHDNFDSDVTTVINGVGARLTPSILRANEASLLKIGQGILV